MSALDELDRAFREALARDSDPPTHLALYWHEAVAMKRDAAAPGAQTRGSNALYYMDGTSTEHEVPNVELPVDRLPDKVCQALIQREAASWEGPRSIHFRYERADDGAWSGGYTIETSSQYRELVQGRADLDRRLGAALAALVIGDVERVSLLYGVDGWKDPGPKLKVKRAKPQLVDPDPAIAALWAELVAYMREHGVKHLYYADLTVYDATTVIREGRGIQLLYGR